MMASSLSASQRRRSQPPGNEPIAMRQFVRSWRSSIARAAISFFWAARVSADKR